MIGQTQYVILSTFASLSVNSAKDLNVCGDRNVRFFVASLLRMTTRIYN
jgi:hypothetical protein